MLEQIVKKSIIGILLTLTALAFILTDSAVGKEQSSALKFIDTISATVNVQAATTIPGKWIQASDGRWWYRHDDGTYTKNNWEYIGGKWYYFDADGWMKTGWILVGGKWYWLSPSGDMVTGWKSIDGTWYYFNSSGAMQTGWQKVDGIWYYFNASGAMQTGWLTLGNNKYYLESSGAMVTGTRIINGTRYTFAESGELISSEPVSTSKGEQIVEHALQYAGNPFKWGGTSLTAGCDSGGFTKGVFSNFSVTLPADSKKQAAEGTAVKKDELQAGDLVFYNEDYSHVAIYIGNNRVIHAVNGRMGIRVTALETSGDTTAYRRCWN